MFRKRDYVGVDSSDSLMHYGVKGMKWGKNKRKDGIRSTVNNATNAHRGTMGYSTGYKLNSEGTAYVPSRSYIWTPGGNKLRKPGPKGGSTRKRTVQ